MSLTWFYIIITVAVVGLIVMVFSEYPMLRRAKAGKADKYVFGHTFARRLSQISVGESCFALADYEQMVAAGDSMKDYNIHNGDIILVSRYDETARKNIDHYPVIAIKLQGVHLPFDSDLKLRKFVGYVGNDDWNAAYDTYQSRVKKSVGRDAFIASCAKSYGKNRFPLTSPKVAIISETYDVDSQCYHYSVHATDCVYGKVVFASGKE